MPERETCREDEDIIEFKKEKKCAFLMRIKGKPTPKEKKKKLSSIKREIRRQKKSMEESFF